MADSFWMESIFGTYPAPSAGRQRKIGPQIDREQDRDETDRDDRLGR
jgi:hypothetical protein